MSKLFWKTFQLGLAVLLYALLTENISLASEPSNQNSDITTQTSEAKTIPTSDDAIAQITSISQLSDVQPTDWAFGALQSLVERYGCIAGYLDSTYRGNRALTRYEFAAGLNACLNRINELIATASSNQVTKEDLTTLQKLQEEFADELASLRGRVDTLEASTTELEANQFSTTTQLVGELITYLNDAFGENADDVNNTNLGYRLRLDFNTSFTGEDRLRTRLQATNLRLLDTGATFGGSQGLDPIIEEPIGFGLTGETRFTPSSVSQNGEVDVTQIQYRFPVGDRWRIYLDFGTTDPTYVTDTISPFVDTATGALSNFGQVNPVYFPIGNQGGVSANFLITPSLSLDFGYLGQDGDVNDPGEDAGIFNGGYSALVQLVYNSDRLKFALLYLNFYSTQFGADTLAGSNPAKVNIVNDINNPDNNNRTIVIVVRIIYIIDYVNFGWQQSSQS